MVPRRSRYAILVSMKKLFFIITALYFVLFPTKVMAASEFTTSFTSEYVVAVNGKTSVKHTISLKNNLAHIYATEYTIATSGNNLLNITTSDESGPITNSTNIQNGATTIHVVINHPAIGKDQVKTIIISYQTDDATEKIGNTLTINIPRLAKANEAENYTRIVKIQGLADQKSYIFPPQSKTEPEDDYTVYTFLGHQNESITLLFGESVTYSLNLTYELRNKELKNADSELALPPDTAYQRVVLSKIDPPPKDVRVDESGNWLARYSLKAQEKLVVSAELFIVVYPQPSQYDPSTTTFKKTSHSKYWEPSNATIESLADQLKSPENIYNYLVSNFTYNYDGINSGSSRAGAIAALASPTKVLCTEFTDVFVSLARSLSIPSREINGYGYTKKTTLQPQNLETDILHAWPEYYDKDLKTWIAIDPTWGNTTGGVDYYHKLDFSHLTFVRHGEEDSYPLPAGAYKSNPADKFIVVEVAETTPVEISTSETRNNVLYNTGNVAIIDKDLGYIPPYGNARIENTKKLTLYDKIKLLCVRLLSKFSQQQPVSM